MTVPPPPRPASTKPEDLRFHMQRLMVRWLSPPLLADTAMRVFLSSIFGAYSDKREIQAALPVRPLPDYSKHDDFWLDFVADVGDAFGPTYSIASCLAAESLAVGRTEAEAPGPDGLTLPRGRVVVLGGDQVYPTANHSAYQDRTLGPYRAALPYVAENPPHLYALPGNHDWYDGLTAFMRVFCRRQWIGGWETQQTRSYFAVKLPGPWRLWAVDVQLDAYIDEPQLDYFRDQAKDLDEKSAVILCSAMPSWVYANEDDHEAFSRLDYFERKIIAPTGARVLLGLSGDAHHYARYEAIEGCAQRITAGGGGAYLSATHHLPARLELPPSKSTDQGKTTPPAEFRFERSYPDAKTSRWRRFTVASLPIRNWSFWGLVGAVHLIYLWLIQGMLRASDQGFHTLMQELSWTEIVRGMVRSPVALMISAAALWGLMGFTKSKVLSRRLIGAAHAVAQLAAVVLSIRMATLTFDGVSSSGWYVAGVVAFVAVVGGLIGSMVMAAYLALADCARINTNELFAAQRNRDYKNFLRIHIAGDGKLTVYPVGLRRTIKDWEIRKGGGPGDSWLVPARDGVLLPHLIEDPIVIDPGLAPPGTPGVPASVPAVAPAPSPTPASSADATSAAEPEPESGSEPGSAPVPAIEPVPSLPSTATGEERP